MGAERGTREEVELWQIHRIPEINVDFLQKESLETARSIVRRISSISRVRGECRNVYITTNKMKKRTNDKIYTHWDFISILDKMSNFCSKRAFHLFNWMNETNACKDWILIYHRMEYNEILKGLLERSWNDNVITLHVFALNDLSLRLVKIV